MNSNLKWFIYIFIAVATAIGVAFTSSDAGLIDCILVGLGNGIFNFFLVEVVFKKEYPIILCLNGFPSYLSSLDTPSAK